MFDYFAQQTHATKLGSLSGNLCEFNGKVIFYSLGNLWEINGDSAQVFKANTYLIAGKSISDYYAYFLFIS